MRVRIVNEIRIIIDSVLELLPQPAIWIRVDLVWALEGMWSCLDE